MKAFPASTILIPGLAAVAGLAALVVWMTTGSIETLQARVPGLDRREGQGSLELPSLPLVGRLTAGSGKPGEIQGEWPWFRGKDLDNIAKGGAPLARQWPPGGPTVLWSVELGEGHAGPAVRDGRVYLLDYDREKSCDALRCLSLADGKEIWRYSYPVEVKRYHGMSRTVPALGGSCVVAIGPKCHVTCLDATTGKELWTSEQLYGIIFRECHPVVHKGKVYRISPRRQ